VSSLRAVKDGAEVVALRSAVRLADEALAAVLPRLRPGMPELEGAWLIESYLRQHGAEGLAFETIVAGGSNGARPHARASSAALPAGEPIVIDMGARVGGYCSDVTRTVCLGQPTDPVRFWEIYNLVLKAQGAAKSVARAGMTGRQVDSVARDVIAAAGYGANFGHSLGHGVGLAVHEEPLLSRRYEGLLAAGNVVTLEPGVYLPGWGGVRIEDMIVLNDEGAEVLTAAPKDPLLPIS
jgi:Xaa-Pro aminopeptidase